MTPFLFHSQTLGLANTAQRSAIGAETRGQERCEFLRLVPSMPCSEEGGAAVDILLCRARCRIVELKDTICMQMRVRNSQGPERSVDWTGGFLPTVYAEETELVNEMNHYNAIKNDIVEADSMSWRNISKQWEQCDLNM
ncbi:hypothetical protein J1605_000835 [Eschrichtius robustus]|uniref:Uncharacterized protein n=1 Tax=Eschrichtius robustus TaxID=9764 RepID=A0AB34GNP0_ESCRO|nr:hypothetical protein J1605_000835 [Eschrichtius robustus]